MSTENKHPEQVKHMQDYFRILVLLQVLEEKAEEINFDRYIKSKKGIAGVVKSYRQLIEDRTKRMVDSGYKQMPEVSYALQGSIELALECIGAPLENLSYLRQAHDCLDKDAEGTIKLMGKEYCNAQITTINDILTFIENHPRKSVKKYLSEYRDKLYKAKNAE